MAFNKLNNLIEKYNLTNIIKVCIILVVLYLVARVFIPDSLIDNIMPAIIENFDTLGNGIYGNELSLNNPTNTPSYNGNTCILELAGTYRIDSLLIKFNEEENTTSNINTIYTSTSTSKDIIIQFQDGNGNMRNITTPSHNESPPTFLPSELQNGLKSITDENGAPVYTSRIVLTIGNSFNDISTYTDRYGNGYISSFGIYGGERNLLSSTDFDTLSPTLTRTEFTKSNAPSTTQTQSSNSINTYTFNNINSNNAKIYSMKLTGVQSSSSTAQGSSSALTTSQFKTTDSPFNIKITYSNTIYPTNTFSIMQTYIVRSDNNSVEGLSSFIFLIDPIIANSITLSVSNVNNVNDLGFVTLKITGLTILGKNPSASDISDYKINVNSALNSIESEQNGNICPNINELVDKQTTTQQICDNLEFQDKTKSEKLRLERNKQYLLKLQNQQEKIDQLNNVIQSLETQRENRATISDKVRVLQYQKQAGDASTIRDLANQRIDSQANNQLYLDVKVNKIN